MPLPKAMATPIGDDIPASDVLGSNEVASAEDSLLAPQLDNTRSTILSLTYHGTNEDCTHSAVEALILNPMTYLCKFRSCSLRRNRNGVDSSGATLSTLRPDVLVWLPSEILAFKGEDKAFGVGISEARKDLVAKMAVFTDTFFGEVPYQLTYACAGSILEFWALVRTENPYSPRPVQLAPAVDLSEMRGRSLCVRYVANIARVLIAIQEKHPRGNILRLGNTVESQTSTVFIEGLQVIKKTRYFTGNGTILLELYGEIAASGGIPHLIRPTEQPRISRSGILTVKLAPVGFCTARPFSMDEAKEAGRQLLVAIRWLHANGYVHRDIRGANIMRANSRWYLIDLEWANHLDQTVGGYRPFLCPPECSAEDCLWSASSDIWQFGKLLESWGQLDDEGHALVRVLTSDSPSERLPVEEAMQHPFFGAI